jgi:hypothetical protein
MGVINILLGAIVLIFGLVIFMQPILLLADVANTTISGNNPVHQGRNMETGAVEDVGQAIFAPDLVIALIFCIGIAFVIGFIIYAVRGGPDDPNYYPPSGGEIRGL